MLKIGICDDDLESTIIVKKMLESQLIEQKVDAEIIIVTDDQEKIERMIKNKEIDFLFLDVEFKNGGMNGIEFAKKLRKYNKDFYLVFLSAHQRFLYLALVTKIFDYLVKPLNKDTVHDLLERIKDEFSDTNNLFVNISKWQSVKANEIIYMEKSINRTILTTTKGKISCTKTLEKMEDTLPSSFVRCHRSFIINKNKIISLDKKSKEVTLENNIICPINDKFSI